MRTDAELLAAYGASRDEAAFAELAARHGPMVFRTCLRILGNQHDAEEASQAAFVVLARKAGSLGRLGEPAAWLHEVARRVAFQVLHGRLHRAEKEAAMLHLSAPAPTPVEANLDRAEVCASLDRELAALSAGQRQAVILRYLEERGEREAAEIAGCPLGTLSRRASDGLARLRERFARRRVALSAAALAGVLAAEAQVTVPGTLVPSILAVATSAAAGGAVGTGAMRIAEAAMKAVFWTKLKMAAAVLAGAVLVGAGGGAAVRLAAGEPATAPKAVPAAVPADATTILDSGSFWRFHVSLRKPVVPAGKDGAAPGIIRVEVPYRSYPGIENIETALPPAGWAEPDFADGDWPRAPVQPAGQAGHGAALARGIEQVLSSPGVQFSTGVLCLRGKFAVSDPAAVKSLYLSLGYRGGAVVYLNGREVARQDLPEGKLDAATPGQAYPPEAYLDSKGKLIPEAYHLGRRVAAGEKDLAERVAGRDRALGPLELPRAALRKRTNILGIELHRSDYHPAALQSEFSQRCGWVPVGLLSVRLAAAGGGAAPNVARPKGFQVWNQDVNDRVSPFDYGDPNEKLAPVVIAGARNGSFSGQVVVGSGRPLSGLRAVPGELKAVAGNGLIPAAQVQVRWGRFDGVSYKEPEWFDGLMSSPPAEVRVHKGGGAVQPVWVTVRVPKEAGGGEYRGALALSAPGAPDATVPLILRVADWTLPDPRDFRTYVGVYQSPTSLALQYSVKEWSEEHWKLMDQSFTLLDRLGNKIVNIPLVDRTQFGNDEGMVTWVRKEDGSYDYDFAVFDRFIELTGKHLGVPDVVALQVWHSGGWEARKADQENTVTVLDKKTGEKQRVQVPAFGTEDSKKFWKPVLDAIRARLARQGMDKGLCLGILSDGTAPNEVFKAFDAIVPGGANWTRGCHSVTRATGPYELVKGGGGRVVLHEFCYGMSLADPAKGLPPIWKQRSWPGTAYIRHNFDDTLSLLKYRTFAERALYCGTKGIGRTCLDFWDCAKDAKGRATRVFNRWPFSSCGQREPNMWRLAWAGPKGAEPTVRFEQMLEGIQAAEAMIVVAEAQAEKAERLGPELAAKCRQVYLDRLNYCRQHAPEPYGAVYFSTCHFGWQELDERLFALAAEVDKKLGKK